MRLSEYVRERNMVRYVLQLLIRTKEWGGLYQEVKKGISRDSSLSPLLGAFYPLDLDKRIEKMEVRHFRLMDDLLILALIRWKLKDAIRALKETFDELKLENHPDKTAMGKIEKGFYFSPEGLSMAEKTAEKSLARAIRLTSESRKSLPASPCSDCMYGGG